MRFISPDDSCGVRPKRIWSLPAGPTAAAAECAHACHVSPSPRVDQSRLHGPNPHLSGGFDTRRPGRRVRRRSQIDHTLAGSAAAPSESGQVAGSAAAAAAAAGTAGAGAVAVAVAAAAAAAAGRTGPAAAAAAAAGRTGPAAAASVTDCSAAVSLTLALAVAITLTLALAVAMTLTLATTVAPGAGAIAAGVSKPLVDRVFLAAVRVQLDAVVRHE
eukprot:CAMPEP_0119497462 /NCGR_PEP_ID=MMETSP1344-20130328/20499_1 /TAXON_ID=236787 /ORGANISM="Florenciella parvula, Strain CCMP2471" /LENGTH=216 /DNA_ID=CAMNT_0007533249 /DNA_START=134 /DNA_END=783 /DNA_ORIENTATION=-